ncbi:MAG: hypothetical protein K6T75_07915 [Acetobacteraceae bacterium]|nr:hypothetical protein [Acetobacteraceae bacterium]
MSDQDERGKARDKVTVEQVESLLAQLPGVLSARIVVNDWGAIEEVHVLATTERNPKQLVRDVESSLAARWGMNIDHKKISVAQVTGMEPTLPAIRLCLANVQSVVDAARGLVELTVTLNLPDDEEAVFVGRAAGPYSHYHILRLAAQAALEALNKTVTARYLFTLEDVKAVNLGTREVIVVLVALITPRGDEELLVGSSLTEHDGIEAAIKATLQATNRRMGRLYARKRARRKKEDRLPGDGLGNGAGGPGGQVEGEGGGEAGEPE